MLINNVDAVPQWARVLSYQTLSTVIGRSLFVYTKKGPLQLNLFSLLIAPSGENKTVALKNHMNPVLSRFQKLAKVKVLLPSDYTTESMKDWFDYELLEQESGKVEKRDSGMLVKDEFTKIFKDIRKPYLSDQLEFLSFLYDGHIPARMTKKGGYQSPNEVSVNLVAATTPEFYRVLPRSVFLQGLGNRFLYVVVDEISPFRDNDPEEYFQSYVQASFREEVFNKLARLLLQYHSVAKKSCLYVPPEVGKRLMEVGKEKRELAQPLYKEDRYDLRSSYLTRLHEFSMKVAALEAVNRVGLLDSTGEKEPYEIDLTLEDANRAIEFVGHQYQEFERMLTLWENIETSERARFRLRDIMDVKSVIATEGGIIPMTTLRRKTGIESEKLWSILLEAIHNGEIKVYEGKKDPSKTGPVTKYFILTSMNVEIENWLHELPLEKSHSEV
jgi:hypothetical protein